MQELQFVAAQLAVLLRKLPICGSHAKKETKELICNGSRRKYVIITERFSFSLFLIVTVAQLRMFRIAISSFGFLIEFRFCTVLSSIVLYDDRLDNVD